MSSTSTTGLSLNEVLYGASSYHEIAKPVALTMILSALVVIFFNTEESLSQGQAQMQASYTVFDVSDQEDGVGGSLLKSIGNSLVIVLVICCMTFGIVLLYKYRCMKCLIGYMIFSSGTLLGFLGSSMFTVAIDKYRVPVSWPTFILFMYNFSLVGTVAIFYQKGIPTFITQGYLVATSVILAWQLSHFDDWTTWTLLVFLALYDLCAVLTPVGPLKALVRLMQREDAPAMPGLLYEASLPGGVSRPGNNNRNHGGEAPSASSTTDPVMATLSNNNNNNMNNNEVEIQQVSNDTYVHDGTSRRTCFVPVAIARIYRLPLLSPIPPPSDPRNNNNGGDNVSLNSNNDTSRPLLDGLSTTTATTGQINGQPYRIPPNDSFTSYQLRTEVEVLLPARGSRRIERSDPYIDDVDESRIRYDVIDSRTGEDIITKTLLVDLRGRVLEEVDDDNSSDGEPDQASSIKLGLGDFIFYSVLVAKAAMYSFTTFITCMLVILAGLGCTLVLLSVYHKALPALPISIFLGVMFYLLTRTVIEPWIEDLLRVPYYV